MSTSKLRPLLPRFIKHLRNHELAKYQSTCQFPTRPTLGHRACLKPGIRAMSSIAQSPEKAAVADVPLVEKTGDSQAVPTSPGDDEVVEGIPNKRVAILWDLDNKTPIALPEHVAITIRSLAIGRGEVIEYSAMANYHAFVRLPPAVHELRRQRKLLLAAERRGEYKSPEPKRCPVCGAKFATEDKLQRHYNQLHARERRKKLNRLNMLKGKKRERWLKTEGKKLKKRNDAHIAILAPEKQHTLLRGLTRAGVSVRIVAKASQAADNALKSRWGLVSKDSNLTLIIVSDDSDFTKMAQRAKNRHGVHVIVVSESSTGKLAKAANEWMSWETINTEALNINNTLPPKALVGLPVGEEAENDDKDEPDYVVEDEVMDELNRDEERELQEMDEWGEPYEWDEMDEWRR